MASLLDALKVSLRQKFLEMFGTAIRVSGWNVEVFCYQHFSHWMHRGSILEESAHSLIPCFVKVVQVPGKQKGEFENILPTKSFLL